MNHEHLERAQMKSTLRADPPESERVSGNDSICYWGILGALVIGFFMGLYMGAGITWQTF